MSNQIGTVVASGARCGHRHPVHPRDPDHGDACASTAPARRRSRPASASTTTCSNSLAHHALFDLEVEATGDLASTSTTRSRTWPWCSAPPWRRRSATARASPASATPRCRWTSRWPRPWSTWAGAPTPSIDLPFRGKRAGKLPLQLIEHVFDSFARAGGVTLNVKGRGRNDHHLAEAAFKALGRALRAACAVDPRRSGPASTKGSLG